MRVLLTGAAGFIGRHVHARLLDNGHDVVPLDSMRTDVHRDSPSRPRGLIVGDLRDAAVLDQALHGVDAVCHLAAKVGLGVDVADLPDYAASNDHGTTVLLAAMARARVHRLTLASSMVVYGAGTALCDRHGSVRPAPRVRDDLAAGRFEPRCPHCGRAVAPELVTEDARLDPQNGYAASKVAQEHYAFSWARETGGSVAALRYHNVFGPGLPHDTPYAGVAAIFLSALRRDDPVHVFEDGAQRRDFVHVSDVAAATVAAVERHGEGTRAFNVGSGTPRSVGELATALALATRGREPVVTGAFRLGDVRHITADSTRVRQELGWAPQVDFAAGVAELALVDRATEGASTPG